MSNMLPQQHARCERSAQGLALLSALLCLVIIRPINGKTEPLLMPLDSMYSNMQTLPPAF